MAPVQSSKPASTSRLGTQPTSEALLNPKPIKGRLTPRMSAPAAPASTTSYSAPAASKYGAPTNSFGAAAPAAASKSTTTTTTSTTRAIC